MADPFDTTDDPPRPSILRARASIASYLIVVVILIASVIASRVPAVVLVRRGVLERDLVLRVEVFVHLRLSFVTHPRRSFVRSFDAFDATRSTMSFAVSPGVRARRAERRGASSCADGGRVRSRAMMFLKISTHPRSLALSVEVAVDLDGRREGRSVRESVWIL